MHKTRKLVFLALIIAQALVLHAIENLIPPLAPGAKLGLANIMTIITLSIFGFREALAVIVIRSVLGPILGGSPTAVLYSLSGGLLSGIGMSIMLTRYNKFFSLLGISTAGAVFHNLGQLITASMLFGSIGILFTYLPILMISSVLTGNFIGLLSMYILTFLKQKYITDN